MIEDFRLKVFETVAALGSFTAAAKELGVSQPAVSQNISELERQLDTVLFIRERGNVSLTAKGKLFKTYSDQILHWYRVAEMTFKPELALGSNEEHTKPLKLKIDDSSEAQIWSSQGDIHISIKKAGSE
ncbi:MAG: LysR family transcriptional regulator [Bacteroidales bacterium]|mgnify:CR=1 FL=1|nr:LysR family transcriptional regulator [Bacteroidales bacterium]